jgi:uncharacterized repeat protein (TIGR03943 family)
VSRETQHVLLLLLGGAMVRITLDDTYLRYVRPGHKWLLLAAGAVVVALAVTALARDSRNAPAPEPHAGDRHAPWLLLAPVLVIALVAPPALGAETAGRAGTVNAVARPADVFAALPNDGELTVAEFVQRVVWDTTASLDGRTVVLTGFTVRRGAATDLARLTITCCAADARPYRVRLDGDVAVEPGTWLRVRGVLQPGSATAATGYVPALTVSGVDVVTAPSDPYEY